MDDYKERALLDLLEEHPLDPPEHVHQLTMREYLQNLGNEARGIFGDDFWVDQVLPDPKSKTPEQLLLATLGLRNLHGDADYLVITDLRYPNEAQRIKNLGGTIWEILRPGLESDGHASEQPLPRGLIDYQIGNTDSVDQLAWSVERTLEDMGC